MPLDQSQVDALAKRKGLVIHRHSQQAKLGRTRIVCVTCGVGTKWMATAKEAQARIKELGH